MIPGLALSLLGVSWVLGGEQGLQVDEILRNITSSPLSYALAFSGAFIWAAYCTVTSKYAGGKNGITLFVLLTALSLWIKYALSDQPEMMFSVPVVVKLLLCGVALGFGYAAWNVGILHGNVTLLAAASYFTPVLSSALAAPVKRAALLRLLAGRGDGMRRVIVVLARHAKMSRFNAAGHNTCPAEQVRKYEYYRKCAYR